jgi:hypothetical protein
VFYEKDIVFVVIRIYFRKTHTRIRSWSCRTLGDKTGKIPAGYCRCGCKDTNCSVLPEYDCITWRSIT